METCAIFIAVVGSFGEPGTRILLRFANDVSDLHVKMGLALKPAKFRGSGVARRPC
jgi:hypothetical protein